MCLVKNLMINIYNLRGIDFGGYRITKDNPYTYHHITKKSLGGKETIENGALLSLFFHQYIHIIETREPELYNYINNVLRQINEQGHEPLLRQILAIDYLLKLFEEKHMNDKNNKNKKLIKEEFTRRTQI